MCERNGWSCICLKRGMAVVREERKKSDQRASERANRTSYVGFISLSPPLPLPLPHSLPLTLPPPTSHLSLLSRHSLARRALLQGLALSLGRSPPPSPATPTGVSNSQTSTLLPCLFFLFFFFLLFFFLPHPSSIVPLSLSPRFARVAISQQWTQRKKLSTKVSPLMWA